MSVFVVVVGLSGMLIALMTSLNERRREMATLRSCTWIVKQVGGSKEAALYPKNDLTKCPNE